MQILSKYYPADVSIVAFGNYGSLEKKRSNWLLLERLFTVSAQLLLVLVLCGNEERVVGV